MRNRNVGQTGRKTLAKNTDRIKLWMIASCAILLLFIKTPGSLVVVAQETDAVAFVNVNVIPMDSDRVLRAHTVVVQGDRIVALGPDDTVTVPSGAQVIEGNGGYLIPGLTDAHVHILDNPDALVLFIANGVTTVRDPNADYVRTGPAILDMRDQIAAGKRLGPTITAAKSLIGPSIQVQTLLANVDKVVGPWFSVDWGDTLNIPADPASGRALVLKAHEEGYDIIKVNWYLNRETFDSIVTTAAELGMPVLGHVPADVGIEHAIESGVEIQHNGNLIAFLAKDYARQPGPNYLDAFDLSEADKKLPELVALMKENDVAFTPTMVVDATAFEMFDNLPDWSQATMFQRPEYRDVPPAYMTQWKDAAGGEYGVVARARGAASVEEMVPPPEAREEILALDLRQLKVLVEGGVPVMAGTDSSAIGVVWGFSLHDELELFVKAGLTPYQALAASTRIPSEVMGDPEEWGTIEEGKRADMVLLGANPLENIANTREILGVMVRGKWLPQDTLQDMLDELAVKYEAQAQGAVVMQPVAIDAFGIAGLAPEGWKEIEPGIFARGNPNVDPTMLLQLSAPEVSSEDLALDALSRFGVQELPAEPFLAHQSAALSWTLYQIETPMAPIALALAETDRAAYLVLLATPGDEMDALARTVFFPALDAMAPVE